MFASNFQADHLRAYLPPILQPGGNVQSFFQNALLPQTLPGQTASNAVMDLLNLNPNPVSTLILKQALQQNPALLSAMGFNVPLLQSTLLNNRLLNNAQLFNNAVPSSLPGDRLWAALNTLGTRPGYQDLFSLGFLFRDIDTDGNMAIEQANLDAWKAKSGTDLNLGALLAASPGKTISLPAFRDFFAKRDVNGDMLWNRDEWDGPAQTRLPETLPGQQPSTQQQQSAGTQNQQTPASNPQQTQGSQQQQQQSQGSSQQPGSGQQGQQTQEPGQQQNTSTDPRTRQTSGTETQDSSNTGSTAEVSKDEKKADLKALWKKADETDGKADGHIDLKALFKKADTQGGAKEGEDDGTLNEEEYKVFAGLLGLKIPYASFKEDGIAQKTLLDKINAADTDGDKRITVSEFETLNATAPEEEVVIDVSDTKAPEEKDDNKDKEGVDETKSGRPSYFDINKNHEKGVERDELRNFLAQFTADGIFTAEKSTKAMVEALDWKKARFAKPFLSQLESMPADTKVGDVVALVFDKLDGDKFEKDGTTPYKYNYGLVRAEMGDLVKPKPKKST